MALLLSHPLSQLEPAFESLIAHHEGALGIVLLGLAAMIEYLFPPFPGDAIVLFGAFLVARRGWPAGAVFLSVLAGSALGCMGVYAVGRALGRAESRWHGRLARLRPRLEALTARFARHGWWYLALNRFLPSVRALLFVAAGMARLPALPVLACGLVSAAAWNALLFALGATVGARWEQVTALVRGYGVVVTGLVALVVLALVIRGRLRKR